MNQTTYRKPYPPEYVKAMDNILATPSGPARWRKSAAVWLNLNPPNENGVTAKDQYRIVKDKVAEKRQHLKTKWGEIEAPKGGAVGGMEVRESVEMPEGMFMFIEMFDRMAFDHSNPDNAKNQHKLWQAFPEFRVAEKHA